MSKVESKSVLERLFGLEMTPRDTTVQNKTSETVKTAKKSIKKSTDVAKIKKAASKTKK